MGGGSAPARSVEQAKTPGTSPRTSSVHWHIFSGWEKTWSMLWEARSWLRTRASSRASREGSGMGASGSWCPAGAEVLVGLEVVGVPQDLAVDDHEGVDLEALEDGSSVEGVG